MKTEKRYTKLTHEAAFKLLQENNWRVDHCAFDDIDDDLAYAVQGPNIGLDGMHEGRFVATSGTEWEHCWKIDEVPVFEVGDRVRVKESSTLAASYLGLEAEVFRIYEQGNCYVSFGNSFGAFSPEELELAPEPDPFDEWYERDWKTTDGTFRGTAKTAFNAGRDYERGRE